MLAKAYSIPGKNSAKMSVIRIWNTSYCIFDVA